MPSLPDSNSPTLQLVRPTPPEIHAQILRHSKDWRGTLSVPAYVEREKILVEQVLTREGGLTPWILVDSTVDKAEQRTTLSGCESIRKQALVREEDENGNVSVRDAICHGVASVYTPEEARQKGYGARMMQEAAKSLKTWQQVMEQGQSTKVAFSVLYSDIGKQFYAKSGWTPQPSSYIYLSASKQIVTRAGSNLPTAMPIYSYDLDELCAHDCDFIRQKLFTLTAEGDKKSSTKQKTVAILPDAATISWHHARENFIASQLFPERCKNSMPEVKGAMTRMTKSNRRIWTFWNRQWYHIPPEAEAPRLNGGTLESEALSRGEKPEKRTTDENTLVLLRIVIEPHPSATAQSDGAQVKPESDAERKEEIEAIAAILQAAREEAAAWGLKNVEIWNPSDSVIAAGKLVEGSQVELIHRDKNNIASLKWFGDEEDEVLWVENEKFGWC